MRPILIISIPLIIIAAVLIIYSYLNNEKIEITKGPWYTEISEIPELKGIEINDSEITFKNNSIFGNRTYKYKTETLKEPIKLGDALASKKIIIQNPDKLSSKLRLFITNNGKIVQEVFYLYDRLNRKKKRSEPPRRIYVY